MIPGREGYQAVPALAHGDLAIMVRAIEHLFGGIP
jgi:hypothetical protein